IDEIKNIEEFEEIKRIIPIREEELKLASLLIEKLSKKFDLSEFKDTYTEKLKELIKAKIEGREFKEKEEKKVEEAKSLMEALKKSVEEVEEKKKKEVEAKAS
ncbi:MAG: Ku protein, partial [Candidatus Aenigmarchaeota archaeon]|nr:Ku protein [Candidatus Aenigmarchaeota archaeon]